LKVGYNYIVIIEAYSLNKCQFVDFTLTLLVYKVNELH